MLLGAAGALLAADWRAEQQSRQAWAEVAPALAEWKPIVRKEVGDIETRYPPAVADDRLRELLRAHRFLEPPAAVARSEWIGSMFWSRSTWPTGSWSPGG
jgi:hypothetical protein